MAESEGSTQLRFPSVDVVEASAGSGKTYALARRYVQLIMSPELKSEEVPLKTILAVTFTNKATLEMKQRILEFLKKIALDAFRDKHEKEDILSCLAIDEESAGKTAHRIMNDIITHYPAFGVQTIDSFINALLSGCAFRLGFASDFRVKEDYRAYLEYSLDRLIDRVSADRNILSAFEDFLEYYLFVENKSGWLSRRDIFGLMESLYSYSNTYGGEFIVPDIKAGDLRKKKRIIIDLVIEISKKVPEQTDRRFVNSLKSFLEKNRDGFDVGKLSAYFKREDFPVKGNAELPERIVSLWKDVRRNLRELCEWESHAIFRSYIEIFTLVLDEFRKLASSDDVIFLQELNTHAKTLVEGEAVGVEEFYYRLATRFRHYLIDEFQDTSRLQWENVLPMVSEALSSGGSLFYVGDKKQAIYRFRGGDVSLFDSVGDAFSDYEPRRTALGKNYRSQKEIVEFNNEIFSAQNLRRFIGEADASQKEPVGVSDTHINTVLNVFRDSEQEWKKENKCGYVGVETLEADSVDERNSIVRGKLLSLVKDVKNRFSFGDIAILTRENRDVKLFTSWLIEEGIPVESERTLNIREHPLIKELISFLRFLNSPIDNLSFASFILGEVFQKATGMQRRRVEDFLFGLRASSREERGVYFYREFRERFTDVWNGFVEEFFKSVGFIPLYEFMVTVLGKFRVMENFPEYQGFSMKFLELIKTKEEDYAGVSSFLEFFESIGEKELYVNVIHTDSVKIMTIHKAKGLEFPVVIVPFLEMEVKIGSGAPGRKKPYVVKRREDNRLSLVQLRKEYLPYSEKLADEYRDEYVRSLVDELDNLYVVLTRAQYEMYLFIPKKAGSSKNIGRILIPFDVAPCTGLKSGTPNNQSYCAATPKTRQSGTPRTRGEYDRRPAGEEKPPLVLPVSRYSDWIGILKDEFTAPSQLINREKILRGEVLHFILSCVGNLCACDRDECLTAAQERSRLAFPRIGDLDEYVSVVRTLLEDEKFKRFFYIEEGELYREKEVVDSSGNTKRIDRLIVMHNEVWIIDYKSSGAESETHREQIIEYMSIISSLYPELKAKAFLIYLDSLIVEEVTVHG